MISSAIAKRTNVPNAESLLSDSNFLSWAQTKTTVEQLVDWICSAESDFSSYYGQKQGTATRGHRQEGVLRLGELLREYNQLLGK